MNTNGYSNIAIGYKAMVPLRPSEELEVLPVHEPSSLHCEYCECQVEAEPTCSQCGAPLRNPIDDGPRYVITHAPPDDVYLYFKKPKIIEKYYSNQGNPFRKL